MSRMNRMVLLVVCGAMLMVGMAGANSDPVVSNVTAGQRTDGSGIVDIGYTLADADGDGCTVSLQVSDDSGSSWGVNVTDISGDLGASIAPGRRTMVWRSKTDLPGVYGENYRVKVTADDGSGPAGMVWVYVNDPGFTGYMSKYETTNAQYCAFLNAALASGDITVSNGRVCGANGSNSGGDFVGQVYFDTYAASSYSQITYSGGVFSVRSRDGQSMANHPVVEVSWYGATAFANYYGWRLPTEWEWQAVADFDGSYTYGCGATIDHSKANYASDNPLDLTSMPYTSPVDHYASYGYGLHDMAGNVWEWTSSLYGTTSYRVLRGGCWYYDGYLCSVSTRTHYLPNLTLLNHGFRVCR